jgi:hypothetical protein
MRRVTAGAPHHHPHLWWRPNTRLLTQGFSLHLAPQAPRVQHLGGGHGVQDKSGLRSKRRHVE